MLDKNFPIQLDDEVREFFKDVNTYPEYVEKVNMLRASARESFERWLLETTSKKNQEEASEEVQSANGIED